MLFLKLGYCSFLLLYGFSLYIFDMSPLSYFCSTTLHCLLTFLMMSSNDHKFFILILISLILLQESSCALCKKTLPIPGSWRSCLVLSSRLCYPLGLPLARCEYLDLDEWKWNETHADFLRCCISSGQWQRVARAQWRPNLHRKFYWTALIEKVCGLLVHIAIHNPPGTNSFLYHVRLVH